jgi:crotonobetainyl-CoA:carnitine CoA-transferase CaiB-like acyl-CoA transferase
MGGTATALEGVRVIDLTEALAGPYCAMILGDLGADVIKIERPGVGDQSRKWGPPFVGTESAYFLSVNRNKRSVALDIKSEAGRVQLERLLEAADVFICNVPRVESLREAGLLPEPLLARNPKLIYCSITAYGRTGPYAGRVGYDLVAQGEAGLMAATGEVDGSPMRWPVAAADLSSGLWSALSILAALHARDQTGKGQFIDQSLLEGQLSWAPVMAAQHLASGRRPPKLGNRHANIVPYELFQAQDKHLIVAVGTEAQWRRLCEALGLGREVRDNLRFATNADRVRNRAALKLLLDAVFGRRSADYWLGVLRGAEIPCGPVNALDEALNDPQVRHRRMVVELAHPMGTVRALGSPIHLSETPVTYRRRPPLLGEHTAEVLEEAGCGVVGVAPTAAAEVERSLRRPPRYAAEVALRIAFEGAFASASTINVSEGGCAVRVNGLRPRVGDEVTLVTTGPRVGVVASAVVRWSQPGAGTERRVGLRVHSDWHDDPTWRALVAEVVRSNGTHRAAPTRPAAE